jgi:hypothetical protein
MASQYKAKMTQKEYHDLFAEQLAKLESENTKFLTDLFGSHISSREQAIIDLESVSVEELANMILQYPSKAVHFLFRITGASPRSVARDLGFRSDSKAKSISREKAPKLASYFKELMPRELSMASIVLHDKTQTENEMIRAYKGRWEKYILNLLDQTGMHFVKRRFNVHGKTIEIDGASPAKGPPMVAIDIKRIEALEDYQKRTDEINSKARELKSIYKTLFIACIFFSFPDKQHMLLNRLDRSNVDRVYFQDQLSKMVEDVKESASSESGTAN